ncbi:cyclic-di-AMP receptor [Chloroflexota bacterium]
MNKKLILAVVGPADAESVANALVAHQYPVTRMSSMGGFLRQGNTTLLAGVGEDEVESALDVIRFACHSEPKDKQHRATVFVLDAPAFEQI